MNCVKSYKRGICPLNFKNKVTMSIDDWRRYENDEDFEIKDFAVGIVDGEKIKADTWYMVKNGQLVEAGEE